MANQLAIKLGQQVLMIQGFIKSEKLKVLALSGDKRNSLLPELTTFTEAGYRDVGAWYGFVAPPPAVRRKGGMT